MDPATLWSELGLQTLAISGIDAEEHRYTAFKKEDDVKSNQAVQPSKASSKKRSTKGAVLIAIDADKDVDFASWYQQVILKGDLIDYSDISGCYVLKPAAWSIWETMRDWFDAQIRSMGVQNCAFPMFVTEEALQKEESHLEGFAAEVAWITQSGDTKLDKKIAVRPTSETIIYPYYAKWIRSHRDLPLRLNQWNSVVRWEFKNPQPFLRSREFYWQEGHTAHLTEQVADREVLDILTLYSKIYEDFLAIPVIAGKKTEKEKFAGAHYTTTVEAFIPTTGRGIQGATSHALGQNFSKMFDIKVENPAARTAGVGHDDHTFVWQNSWAFTTRVIGVMIMVHGDNKGLVLPPKIAPVQVVIVPVGMNAQTSEEDKQKVLSAAESLVKDLKGVAVRAELDDRDYYSAGWKFNHWELKGVPLRLEIGPSELREGSITAACRHSGEKQRLDFDSLGTAVANLLGEIQASLFQRALKTTRQRVKIVRSWDDFTDALNDKNMCLAPSCLSEDCEDEIRNKSSQTAQVNLDTTQDARAPSMGAKSLCIPFQQPSVLDAGKEHCVNPECQQGVREWCLFGRSY